jgi:hypothetical protein
MSDADWLLLTTTLPTHPSALRVRVWRALKATGAGALREGVYLLPASAPTAPALWDIERTVREVGAEAHMLVVRARDAAQEESFRALFDRRELYEELMQAIKQTRAGMAKASEAELHKAVRALEQQVLAVRANDFFPNKHSERAAAALDALRGEVERHLSPGEPKSRAGGLESRAIKDFQGKTWATRKRPWVDRLATAWLITRFVDRSPRFVWIDNPRRCPKGAFGYDFDGATFSHVDGKVTFEVVLHVFGLTADPALKRLGELVHYIDVGGIPVDAAVGVETLVRGLQVQHPDDDALLAAALPVFDSLYVAMRAE